MGQPIRESDTRRFRPLPSGLSVHDIADRCRQALIEFVTGSAGGWSRSDLEHWVGAHYHPASSAFPGTSRIRAGFALPVSAVAGAFETSLMDAADAVRELLASCANPRMPAFALLAVERGFVAGAQDANGALGHVPIDVAGMTLVDRVASLLAADVLTRPSDYKSVAFCEDCRAVSFEWNACEHEACVDSRESGIVRRDDGSPVSYAAIFPPAEVLK
jgi:hypothetical protein